MTSQSEHKSVSRWRRLAVTGIAGAGLAASMVMGLGAGTASADVLDDLAQEYSTGAGAGQVANLLNDALVMRAQGVRPKPADLQAVTAALEKRPNQAPLIEALQQVVSHQQKTLSQSGQSSAPGGAGFSINQGQWAPNMGGNPMIRETPIFPMPGR
ncbi:hypothetical protein [Mycolicibacterium mengxianglii]|uniref:hypothetical protein n=1 Tax=Mycolicibacterium mengxianglii TaxID=2736649 RepID=UPI0018D00B33|nr:hypothetical protein [Mycolicibacterium mengxianglii]